MLQEVTTPEAIETQARRWHSQQKDWHFHALSPDCLFNKQPGRHALVLENSSDHQIYILYSEAEEIALAQTLVKLLHGDAILEQQPDNPPPKPPQMERILERAATLNRANLAWHHHLFFPHCVYNQDRDRWKIVFEDRANDQLLEVLYDEEPVEDLNKIELLYFAQFSD